MPTIEIRDVAPRDGLQGERPLPPAARIALARSLAAAGLRHVEVASFVSPKAVPAMADADEVFGALVDDRSATWWVLVPNRRGTELARAAGANHLTLTISASDGYSRKNVGRSRDEAIKELAAIADAAGDAILDVVVSCAFGSPFEDVRDPAPTESIVAAAGSAAPTARITLADTTGSATPRRIRQVVDALPTPARRDLGLHLHDTRGTALANALAAIELGIRRFDTSVGGLGGSPFAPGAGGNLATEDLALMLDDLADRDDERTGIDLAQLLAVAANLPDLIGHPVASRVSAAGSLPAFMGR